MSSIQKMKVSAAGFPDDPMRIKRKDFIEFEQDGEGAPTTVTVPDTLLAGGVTSCVVNAKQASLKVNYEIVGPNGDYTITKPASLTTTKTGGTVKVDG
ncbi:MAG TPA: hypothetical protein VJ505_10645 [Holophagaceae bacterium]|nr:hypothetical protein [Holophagaceae bacterium]